MTAYFDGIDLQTKAIVRGQEFLYIFALITLELIHLTHLSIVDNGAIAGYGDMSATVELRTRVQLYQTSF